MFAFRTLSTFLRNSGEVLDEVERADVVLRRRGSDDLVLTTVTRHQALRTALEALARLLRSASSDAGAGGAVLVQAAAQEPGWVGFVPAAGARAFLDELTHHALAAAELGVTEPLADTLERWRGLAAVRAAEHGRGRPHGWEARPVALPDDLDERGAEKARGVVELPAHVRWSGPPRRYDLSDRRDRARVYEQVLREGTDDDVRRFIEVDELLDLWDELVLPGHVRTAWAEWLRRHRGVSVSC